MKRFIILLFTLACTHGIAYSQSCLPESIYFSTQNQIDSFQINFPGCIEIEGDVIINGDDITNVDGLSVLTSVWGVFRISGNNSLSSLEGLGNLTSVGGYLRISACAVTDLSELENLISVGGDLIIHYNSYLTSLTGLINLDSVGGDLKIVFNPVMINLTGLEGLTSIGGNLNIYSNALNSLSGLENITSIAGGLFIGNLEYGGNPFLATLSGLDNIDAGSITDLSIIHNASLSTCEVKCVCDYLVAPNGTIEIHDNAPGCNSQEEVEDACESISVEEITIHKLCTIYPNPSSVALNFTFRISQYHYVTLKVYDVHGREVATLMDEQLTAGSHRVTWNAERLPSGIYFYHLTAGNQSSTGKMVVLR